MKWISVVVLLLMTSCKTVTHSIQQEKYVTVLDTLNIYDSTSVRMITVDSVRYVIKDRIVERERGRNVIIRDTIRVVTQRTNTIKERFSYIVYIVIVFLIVLFILLVFRRRL